MSHSIALRVVFFILILFYVSNPGLLFSGNEAYNRQNNSQRQNHSDSLIQEFISYFEGEFDNYEQHITDISDSVKFPHEHIHSIFRRFPLPELGPSVFFVQQYFGNDPGRTFRLRVYALKESPDDTSVVLSIFGFHDEPLYRNALRNTDVFKSITLTSLKAYPGCDIIWKKSDRRFKGRSKSGSCVISSSATGKTLRIEDDLILSPEGLFILEQGFDKNNELVFGPKSGIHYNLKRCRFFKGWAAVKKEPVTDSSTYVLCKDIFLHDQGQRVRLVTTGGDSLNYEIQIAQLTYSNTSTPVCKLALFELGAKKSKFYIWGEPDAKRLGINLGWIQTGFTLIEKK